MDKYLNQAPIADEKTAIGEKPRTGEETAVGVPTTAVIIVAAGTGTRLEHPLPKAFADIGGRSILSRCLDPIFGLSCPVQVIVVVPSDRQLEATAIATKAAGSASAYLSIVAGSDTRQKSVAAGLEALEDSIQVVLVHDAARAFTPTTVFEAVIDAVSTGGVIPALAVSDTIKRVDAGLAIETVDRSQLVAVQTPQGFPRGALVAAYAAVNGDYTDDASLFAAAGHPVAVIAGDALAFKITTPWDLRRAESLAGPAAVVNIRTGVGIDVHAYDDASPLWLGGLFWPHERGLSGHSDGDAISHAICDALLSAAGLGDLGANFGTSDPRFADAHGEVFLDATITLLAASGFQPINVAVQVVANGPKIGPRRCEIEGRLSALVGAPVTVSATTSDALGFTGREEGVAVIANCLLQSNL